MKDGINEGDKFQLELAAGAVTGGGKPDSVNAIISAATPQIQPGPALNTVSPYYMSGANLTKLVIVFDAAGLEILDKRKIQYRKNRLGFYPVPSSVAVRGANKDRMEVTLPPTNKGETYMIKLDKGSIG